MTTRRYDAVKPGEPDRPTETNRYNHVWQEEKELP